MRNFSLTNWELRMLSDNTEHDDKLPDPEVFTKNLIKGFKNKAVHNKNESMFFSGFPWAEHSLLHCF